MARFLISGALLCGALLAFHVSPSAPAISYAVYFIAASIIILWMSFQTLRVGLTDRAVGALILLALLIRLSFLLALPVGSDDVYLYLWDGKVQSAGIDPYQHPPDAEELGQLYSALLPSSVNHPEMRTVYFPLSQWAFYLAYQTSGEKV